MTLRPYVTRRCVTRPQLLPAPDGLPPMYGVVLQHVIVESGVWLGFVSSVIRNGEAPVILSSHPPGTSHPILRVVFDVAKDVSPD